MNNLKNYTDFINENVFKKFKYRYNKGENPLKRDKTPMWETKKDGDEYYVRSHKGGDWVKISKSKYDFFNKDRQIRFE